MIDQQNKQIKTVNLTLILRVLFVEHYFFCNPIYLFILSD
jgi:hypothetical protein